MVAPPLDLMSDMSGQNSEVGLAVIIAAKDRRSLGGRSSWMEEHADERRMEPLGTSRCLLGWYIGEITVKYRESEGLSEPLTD